MALTRTQKKIVDCLNDGQYHSREEVRTCLFDDLAPHTAIAYHICMIRKHLNPEGYDIACERRYYKTYYRLVRLLASAYTGHH